MAIDASESHDFSSYEPTSTDPGWLFTVIVVGICILINTTLPFWLWINGTFFSAKKKNNQQQPSIPHETSDETSERNGDRNSPIKCYPVTNDVDASGFEKGPGSIISNSVGYSSCDDGSTISQQIARNVMNSRPFKKRQAPRITPKTNKRNIAAAADTEGCEEMGYELSVVEPSVVMSKLDDDAVSALDAVDEGDGVVLSERPFKLSRCEKLLEIADWDYEMKQLWSLAIPYSLQGFMLGIFSTIDVALIGHFIGPMEANAYITVSILIEFTATFTFGFREAIGTLCPQADGAGNKVLMGRYLQMCLILLVIGFIPGCVIWCLYTYNAVIWFGFDESTARTAQAFAYPFMATTLFDELTECLLEYYNVIDHETFSTVIYALGHAVSTVAIVILSLGGWTDLVLVGLVQAFIGFLLLAAVFAYAKYFGWLDDVWEGFGSTFSLKDRRAVHTMMVTAIPLSISWLLTYGEWEVMTIFAGFMGPAEVSAWGMIGFMWASFEYITEGLASAAEVRVGFRVGAGRTREAKICSYKGMYLGLVGSIFSTGIFFILAPYTPGWLTPDPTLQRMVFDLIPLIGFGQISMCVGSICWAIIGGQGRVRLATMIEIVSSWFLAIPVSAILVFVFNYNLLGPCAALVVSYSVGGVATCFIVLTSDWEELSRRVIAYSAANGGIDYDEYNWEDLPVHIQKAAAVLGYTKQSWDGSGDTITSNKEWAELTNAQKNAATLLGYTCQKWDADSDSDSDSDSEEDSNESKEKEGGEKISCSMKVEDDDSGSLVLNAEDLDDMYWDDLPPKAQKAAGVLGINKEMWDGDIEPESSSKYWKDLSPSEQKAARVLGYDKAKWDDDSDSD